MKIELSDNHYFSDLLIFDKKNFFQIKNSFINFILSIFYLAPKDYSLENKKTIDCFKKYLLNNIDENRLNRICKDSGIDLDKMQQNASCLTSKHVIKVLIYLKDVNIQDF